MAHDRYRGRARSELEGVTGVGPSTADQLLDEFGTLRGMSQTAVASSVSIARLDGWSPDSADSLPERLAAADVLLLRRADVDGFGAGKLPDGLDYELIDGPQPPAADEWDLRCNRCGVGLTWGEEYPLANGDADRDAVCAECRGHSDDREVRTDGGQPCEDPVAVGRADEAAATATYLRIEGVEPDEFPELEGDEGRDLLDEFADLLFAKMYDSHGFDDHSTFQGVVPVRNPVFDPRLLDSGAETVELSREAAVVARRELDHLISETEDVEPDPLTDEVFRARDELAAVTDDVEVLDDEDEGDSDPIKQMFEEDGYDPLNDIEGGEQP